MSNLLLRQLRESGIITGDVLPFARANTAADLAVRTNRAVMVLDAINTGDYWVVSEEDAARLEAAGYTRYLTKPTADQHQPPEQEQ